MSIGLFQLLHNSEYIQCDDNTFHIMVVTVFFNLKLNHKKKFRKSIKNILFLIDSSFSFIV